MDKHFGELGLGNNIGRSAGSSRRGKKNNSDKPKQPQRGLGVAQLEKIRLHDQMASYLPSLHSPFHSNLNKEDDMREEMAFSPSFYCSNSSSTSASSPYHDLQAKQQMMMFGDSESLDIRSYGDFPSCSSSSSRLFMPNNVVQETVTLPLLEETMEVEDSIQKKRREDRCRLSTGSKSQNSSSDKSDSQELDLDLKL